MAFYRIGIRTTLWAQLGVLSFGVLLLFGAAKVPIDSLPLTQVTSQVLRSASIKTEYSFRTHLQSLNRVIRQPATAYLTPFFVKHVKINQITFCSFAKVAASDTHLEHFQLLFRPLQTILRHFFITTGNHKI